MITMQNRLRILLVDDQPDFCWDAIAVRPRLLPTSLENMFELIWVQNAQEARWLLEAFEASTTHASQVVVEAGLPPDILIFDYAMNQGGSYQRKLDDPTYPVPRMKRLLARHGIVPRVADPGNIDAPPITSLGAALDRTGCYIGGNLGRAFHGFPVGLVPTTAQVDTSRTDAAFYEWLNEQYFLDAFKYKSRTRPEWSELLRLGTRCLREKIVILAQSGAIRVDLKRLGQLAAMPDEVRNESLVINSKFGERELPIQGIFADATVLSEEGDEPFPASAKLWANRVLEAQFKGRGSDEFYEAKQLAEQYWMASLSEASTEREVLSILAAMPTRTPEDERALEESCIKIGVSCVDVRKCPEKVKVQKRNYFMPHLCNVAKNDIVARWAVLMLTIRAEQFYQCATEDHERFGLLLTDEDRDAGEIERADLEDRGEEVGEVNRLTQALQLRRVGARDQETIELPVARGAGLGELYLALDPLPENLLIYKHRGKKAKLGRSADPGYLIHALRRLGQNGSDMGPLALNLSDVLRDRPFDCELCRSAIAAGVNPPAHPKGLNDLSHGVRTGEGQLLRIYADELRFPEKKWPAWLRNAP